MINFVRTLFSKKTKSLYEQFGGHNGLESLVYDFYHIMETDPKAIDCLKAHPIITDESKDRLVMFFSGWLGGPNLFVEQVGPPRMRMRHMHIKIGEKQRDQWLYCMNEALKKRKMSKKTKHAFMNSCKALAFRIQNSHAQ